MSRDKGKRQVWLILSYRANMGGSACSQHIDDRLPYFMQEGIDPILLSGPIGPRYKKYRHYRTFSLAPSGIRFELRHRLRKRLKKRWQFKLVETILLLPVFPLYLLEKIIINLESEWSWFFLASVRGLQLCKKYRPDVIYATGGSASAHVAALIIKRFFQLPLLVETQDPLVHDHGWRRGKRVKQLYCWLERKIFSNADYFVFLDKNACKNAEKRVGKNAQGVVIYPGGHAALFTPVAFKPSSICNFSHFGTLGGTRNLVVFFRALALLLEEHSEYREKMRVDVYGSLDDASRNTMDEKQLKDIVVYHGVQPRQVALQAMQTSGCLLLIQDLIFFATETIPSKVYEYFLSGRPILGLLYSNEHLTLMLVDEGHRVANGDDEEQVRQVLEDIITGYFKGDFNESKPSCRYTVARAVQSLVALANSATTSCDPKENG